MKGWEKFTARRDWDADFTVYSTGPVDLAWASRDVLLSLPGFNEQIVDRFLELSPRPGWDRWHGRRSGFKSLDQVRLRSDSTPQQFAGSFPPPLIGFNDLADARRQCGKIRRREHERSK